MCKTHQSYRAMKIWPIINLLVCQFYSMQTMNNVLVIAQCNSSHKLAENAFP